MSLRSVSVSVLLFSMICVVHCTAGFEGNNRGKLHPRSRTPSSVTRSDDVESTRPMMMKGVAAMTKSREGTFTHD